MLRDCILLWKKTNGQQNWSPDLILSFCFSQHSIHSKLYIPAKAQHLMSQPGFGTFLSALFLNISCKITSQVDNESFHLNLHGARNRNHSVIKPLLAGQTHCWCYQQDLLQLFNFVLTFQEPRACEHFKCSWNRWSLWVPSNSGYPTILRRPLVCRAVPPHNCLA